MPTTGPGRLLQNHQQLDKKMTHWNHLRLGLQVMTGSSLHDGIRQSGARSSPTYTTKTPGLSIAKRTDNIWGKETTHKGNLHIVITG